MNNQLNANRKSTDSKSGKEYNKDVLIRLHCARACRSDCILLLRSLEREGIIQDETVVNTMEHVILLTKATKC